MSFLTPLKSQAENSFEALNQQEKAYFCSYASFEMSKAILKQIVASKDSLTDSDFEDLMNKARTSALYVSILLDKSQIESQEVKDKLKAIFEKDKVLASQCKSLVEREMKLNIEKMAFHNDNVSFLLNGMIQEIEDSLF